MKKLNTHKQILFGILLGFVILSACSGKIDSIAVTKAFPSATLSTIRSAFVEKGFSFNSLGKYKSYELTTAVSPDRYANLQVLTTGEEVQAARVSIYLPIDATSEYANAQNEYLMLLLNIVLGESWPAENWIYTATSAIASHSNASLQGGATETTNYQTGAGEIPLSLYVRLNANEDGLIMAVVIGDWVKDIQFDPTTMTWDL